MVILDINFYWYPLPLPPKGIFLVQYRDSLDVTRRVVTRKAGDGSLQLLCSKYSNANPSLQILSQIVCPTVLELFG